MRRGYPLRLEQAGRLLCSFCRHAQQTQLWVSIHGPCVGTLQDPSHGRARRVLTLALLWLMPTGGPRNPQSSY